MDNNQEKNKIARVFPAKKKICLFIVAVALFFTGVFAPILPVQRAQAIVPNVSLDQIWEWVLNGTMAVIEKEIMDRMVDQIVTYIQTGEKPKFIEDPQGFLRTAGDNSLDIFLDELNSPAIKGAICNANWAPKILLSLRKPPKFSTRAACTFSGTQAAWGKFIDNFNDGGWKSWLEINEGANNPYAFYISAYSEKLEREAEALTGAEMEGQFAGGFLSDKRCMKGYYYDKQLDYAPHPEEKYSFDSPGLSEDQLATYSGVPDLVVKCTEWRSRTPGTIAAEGFSKSAFKNIQFMQDHPKWEQYLAAILDASLNKLYSDVWNSIKKGKPQGVFAYILGGGTKSTNLSSMSNIEINGDYPQSSIGGGASSSGLGYGLFDDAPVAPTTELVYYDPWRIQIKTASVSSVPDNQTTILYTTDESNPEFSPTATKSDSPTFPISITGNVKIRWISATQGIDLTEKEKSVNLTPPFLPPYISAQSVDIPFTVVAAIDETHVALVSDKQLSNIYYTYSLDGSDPVNPQIIDNNLYVQVIEVPAGKTLKVKWFGWNSYGSETMHFLKTISPFPNKELPIVGMPPSGFGIGGYPPTAAISAPSQILSGEYVTLDPSNSHAHFSYDKIVKYEWDLDNDAVYDWKVEDPDHNGTFNAPICTHSNQNPPETVCTVLHNIGNGFAGMNLFPDGNPGKIKVIYMLGGPKIITLRITDNNGTTAVKSVTTMVYYNQ